MKHVKVSKDAFFVLCVALVPITEPHSCQRACVCVKLATRFSQLRPLLLLTLCANM